MINLLAIQTDDKIFIKDNENYGSKIPNLLFDGEKATTTYKPYWYSIKKVPEKIQQQGRDQYENTRYALKAGYPESKLTPKVIHMASLEDSEYEEVSGLYERKCDIKKGELEDVEYKINIIAKRNKFEFIKKDFAVKYNLLDELNTHPDLLDEKSCYIPSEKAYEIIRQHIKNNLDGRYASIKADFDFHFEVVKKIKLAEPIKNVRNANEGTRKKKSNWVTTYTENKTISVLNIKRSPKDSDYGKDCFIPKPFIGENYEDMVSKMNQYLESLVQEINTPYQECSHCNGWGVILNENN